MGKYFTVTVKPTITASKQALGAFADFDVLFDWTAFDVPRGACKLINTAMFSRGADGVINSHAVHLYFGKSTNKSAPNSIGTIHATASGTRYYNSLLSAAILEENDQAVGLDYIQSVMQHFNRQGPAPMILQGETESGTNVGYDKLYVAGISADGTPSFASTIQCDGVQATSQAVLTVKTTDCRNVFDVGDVLYDEDDRLMGTVKSMDSDTQMTMEDNLANATVNNKDLYVISPITLQLMFEK
tara:strand:- start:332 stop:1060 length:729 start_codon:yes stop_codon:yes gene_type:complete